MIKRMMGVVVVGFVLMTTSRMLEAACPTAVPSGACTESQFMSSFSSVVMCFNSIDFLKDNGSCASDKSALSCWDRDRLATGPFEVDVFNLGSGASLASLGAEAGGLFPSTSYPCQIADVESVILGFTDGTSCSATASIASEYPADFFENMVIRGIDACPGTDNYPPGLPIQTADATSAAFKFNVQFGSSGAPLFIFKPLDAGATLDTSNITTISATATGAAATGNVYCGIFKNSDPQQGGGPDAGGGQGSVSGGTATCTISGSPGSYQAVGMFQDVDGSGAEDGPAGSDLICLSDAFTATAGQTTTVSCGAFVTFSQLMAGGGQ